MPLIPTVWSTTKKYFVLAVKTYLNDTVQIIIVQFVPAVFLGLVTLLTIIILTIFQRAKPVKFRAFLLVIFFTYKKVVDLTLRLLAPYCKNIKI